MNRRRLPQLIALVALVTFSASIPSFAQGMYGEREGIEKKFQQEMMQMIQEYWTPKLSGYKQFIDKSISVPDFNELTTLRTRWSIYMETMRKERDARMAEYRAEEEVRRAEYERRVAAGEIVEDRAPTPANGGYGEYEEGYDNAVTDSTAMTEIVEAPEPHYGTCGTYVEMEEEATFSTTAEISVATPEMGDESGIYEERMIDTAHVYDHTESPATVEVEASEEYYEEPYRREPSETEILFKDAETIGNRYNVMHEDLRKKMIDDLSGFFLQVSDWYTAFVQKHRAEIDADPNAVNWLSRSSDDLQKIAIESSRREMAEELLEEGGEELRSFVMLYNGEGLMGLIGDMGMAGEFIAKPKYTDAAAAGSAMLQQNTPNPASAATSIPFTLGEPSRTTLLRIYDPNGKMVAEINGGSLPMGEQQITVDVSEFPAGSYIYRLSVQTSEGERILSKTMQVMH